MDRQEEHPTLVWTVWLELNSRTLFSLRNVDHLRDFLSVNYDKKSPDVLSGDFLSRGFYDKTAIYVRKDNNCI